jgi:hypothetical protein
LDYKDKDEDMICQKCESTDAETIGVKLPQTIEHPVELQYKCAVCGYMWWQVYAFESSEKCMIGHDVLATNIQIEYPEMDYINNKVHMELRIEKYQWERIYGVHSPPIPLGGYVLIDIPPNSQDLCAKIVCDDRGEYMNEWECYGSREKVINQISENKLTHLLSRKIEHNSQSTPQSEITQ